MNTVLKNGYIYTQDAIVAKYDAINSVENSQDRRLVDIAVLEAYEKLELTSPSVAVVAYNHGVAALYLKQSANNVYVFCEHDTYANTHIDNNVNFIVNTVVNDTTVENGTLDIVIDSGSYLGTINYNDTYLDARISKIKSLLKLGGSVIILGQITMTANEPTDFITYMQGKGFTLHGTYENDNENLDTRHYRDLEFNMLRLVFQKTV
jgi:hypothetical protein